MVVIAFVQLVEVVASTLVNSFGLYIKPLLVSDPVVIVSNICIATLSDSLYKISISFILNKSVKVSPVEGNGIINPIWFTLFFMNETIVLL